MTNDPGRLANVRPVVMRLPDATYEALKAEADASGRSVSELIREAITLRAAFLTLERVGSEQELHALLAELLRPHGS